MDFTLAPESGSACGSALRAFVAEEIHARWRKIPRQAIDEHENIAEELSLLEALRVTRSRRSRSLGAADAEERGVASASPSSAMAVCYEEMGRSIFGPVAFNCAAPDDGNMIVLQKIATEAQKSRWLQPIVDGKVRSAFAMTEPAPGRAPTPA